MSNQGTAAADRRIPCLDVLRAVGVLLVLGCHMPTLDASAFARPVAAFLGYWRVCGWIGVDLFFVLSGFLISGLIFREYQIHGNFQFGRFFVRRGFKIYPGFYLMFWVVIALVMSRGQPFIGWRVALSELLFVQNYSISVFPQSWSLAVEEHFYLLLPLLLLALRGAKEKPFASLPRFFVIITALVTLNRVLMGWAFPFHFKTHYTPTHLRIDALLFGVVLGYFFHYHRPSLMEWTRRWRGVLALLAVGATLPALLIPFGSNPFLYTVYFNILYLGSGAALLLALHYQVNSRPLAFLGANSYAIYLWHIPVCWIGLTWLPKGTPPALVLLVYFAASILVGVLATWLVEAPLLRLRDRISPGRAKALKDAAREEPAALEEPAIAPSTP